MDLNVGIAKFNALRFEVCFETRIDNFVWYFGIYILNLFILKFAYRILTLLTTSNLCKMKVL
jgi:hypothetical protein